MALVSLCCTLYTPFVHAVTIVRAVCIRFIGRLSPAGAVFGAGRLSLPGAVLGSGRFSMPGFVLSAGRPACWCLIQYIVLPEGNIRIKPQYNLRHKGKNCQ